MNRFTRIFSTNTLHRKSHLFLVTKRDGNRMLKFVCENNILFSATLESWLANIVLNTLSVYSFFDSILEENVLFY